MQRLIRRVFGVYPGEGKTVFRFTLLASTWSFSTAIATTLSASFFLNNIGAEYLPISYFIASVCMICTSSLFIYLLRRMTPAKILMGVMTASAIFQTIASIFLIFPQGNWIYFAYNIYAPLFDAALIACYWTFLDRYHDLQEAKRIYGIYNASYYLGYAIGGILINQFIDKIGPIPFFIITSSALFFSIFQIYAISKNVHPIDDDSIDEVIANSKRSIRSIIYAFSKSPFALTLISLSLLCMLLRTCTEINYMETFSKIFDPALSTPDNPITSNTLPEFLGKCLGFISFGNIILGMFFYRKAVKRIGITNMTLVPAIVFFLVYSEWVLHDSLFVAIFGVIAVNGVLFTIEDNNFNLLMNAAPRKLQGMLRIINDSFFEPIGMLLSSTALFFLATSKKSFGFILTILFLIVTLLLRSFFSKSMLSALRENAIHFERKIRYWLKSINKKDQKEIIDDLLAKLQHEREDFRLSASQALLSFKDLSLLEKVLSLADHLSLSGKCQLIRLIEKSAFSNHSLVIEKFDMWQKTSDNDMLTKTIIFFFAKKGLLHPEKVGAHLDTDDLLLRASAIVTLKKSVATQSPSQAGLNRTIAAKELDLLLKSANEEEIQMGLEILRESSSVIAIEKALSFLFHPSLLTKRVAAHTIAILANKKASRFSSSILEALSSCSDNCFRLSCIKALGKIGDSTTVFELICSTIFFRPNERRLVERVIIQMGLKTVPILISMVKKTNLHDRSRLLAGKILGTIALPQLRANLIDIISSEIERAYFYFYYGHKIPLQYPLYDLSLLQCSLLSSYQSVIDFIIHILGAAGSIEDCDLLVHTLHSKNAKSRANAIETLEKNCDSHIFSHLYPLLDETPWENKLETWPETNKQLQKLSLTELLEKLQKSSSLFDRTVSAHLQAQLKIPNWKESLREQMKTSDELFHHFSYELLET